MTSPKPRRHTGWIVFAAVVAVILICMCGITAALSTNSKSDDTATETTSTSGTSQHGGKTLPGLNMPARDGKFEFVVTSIKCGLGSVGEPPFTKGAQGQFCLIGLSVTNIGTKPQLMALTNQKAKSTSGATYAPDAGVLLDGAQNLWLTEINPGNSVSGHLAFDVPAGAELASLELHDSMLSGGVSIALR